MSWHPKAIRVPYGDAGTFLAEGNPRLVHHTTETKGLPRYSGSAPHFTFDPATNRLWQHIDTDRAAKSLEHPSGTVDTNRSDRVIQVELIGYAAETHLWPKHYYENIANLARWIERDAKVKRQCSVKFTDAAHVERLSSNEWLTYSGHLGHQHVPNNHHWDPGRFRIEEVLGHPGEERKRQKWIRSLAFQRARLKRTLNLRRQLRDRGQTDTARYRQTTRLMLATKERIKRLNRLIRR